MAPTPKNQFEGRARRRLTPIAPDACRELFDAAKKLLAARDAYLAAASDEQPFEDRYALAAEYDRAAGATRVALSKVEA